MGPGPASSTEFIGLTPPQRVDLDPVVTVKEMVRKFGLINGVLHEREKMVEQAIFALLTRQHHLIVGEAGTAKSLFIKFIRALIGGDVRKFSLGMRGDLTPDNVLGAYIVDEVMAGRMIRNIEGYLPTANLAFFDELFRAQPQVLNALNTVLSDRELMEGCQQADCPLHCVFAATNPAPIDSIGPFLDRFPIRSAASRIISPVNRRRMRTQPPSEFPLPSEQQIDFEKIVFLANVVAGLDSRYTFSSPGHIDVLADAVIDAYEQAQNEDAPENRQRYVCSDRVRKTSGLVLAASALRAGRFEIKIDDLSAFQFLIPTVGIESEEKCFDSVLKKTLDACPTQDRTAIDRLCAISDLMDHALRLHEEGVLRIPSRSEIVVQRFLHYFHWTGRVDFTRLRNEVDHIRGELSGDIARNYRDCVRSDLIAKVKGAGIDFATEVLLDASN